MTRRRRAPSKPLRLCIYCNMALPEQRPVFLVGHPSGRVVGPYHAGCAEKFLILAERHQAPMDQVLGEEWGRWPSRREETLPE